MKHRKFTPGDVVVVLLTLAAIVVFVIPLYLAVITAFKSKPELSKSVLAWPEGLYLENFKEGMRRSDFFHSLRNSVLVTFPSVILIVLCASMSGYSVARHAQKTAALRLLDKMYLASLMIPFQILMIPVYRIYKSLNLLNSLPGMVLMLTGTSIAYASFLYVGFVKSIPREIEESAYMDGCSEIKTFWLITFPLLKPISATVAALHVMWLWNDFNISIILLQKEMVRTITVKQFYFFGQYTAEYGLAFAAAIVSMIPVVTCFAFMQKYIVNGIAAGAVKS
ncbi:carbohydrate ABC transporter permease [Parablautia muri]|uniref:Carbohydrate ABC transporter permease n=1 Tax=Parablautia muri TaxID=2320879 RepID=A0A9X5GRP9_9FIRM|nr:carbohydrate ABC transporter permease [Parablautia muri]NBJ92396.1 carbohydrate ABC transporter permease [Parablautia muri]